VDAGAPLAFVVHFLAVEAVAVLGLIRLRMFPGEAEGEVILVGDEFGGPEGVVFVEGAVVVGDAFVEDGGYVVEVASVPANAKLVII